MKVNYLISVKNNKTGEEKEYHTFKKLCEDFNLNYHTLRCWNCKAKIVSKLGTYQYDLAYYFNSYCPDYSISVKRKA